MKYILVFVSNGSDGGTVFGHNLIPGSMYEVGRYSTIEEASKFSKTLHVHGDFVIIPFYECN